MTIMGVAVLLLVWVGWHVNGRMKAANTYIQDQSMMLAEQWAAETQTHGREDIIPTTVPPEETWSPEQTGAAPLQSLAASADDTVYLV